MTHFRKLAPGLLALTGLCFLGTVKASAVWTFSPLTSTQVTVDSSSTATIQYTVTNQSRRSHTLTMTSIPGVTRTTTAGNCGDPLTLGYQESCTLTLVVMGSELTGNVVGGPVLCQQGGGTLQCYEPILRDILNVTLSSTTPPVAIGDSFGGGTVACLTSGGGEANLIAATVDNSEGTVWGGANTTTGAQSDTEGAANTSTIVDCLSDGGGCTTPLSPSINRDTYAAGICDDYTGGGYTDWFLPAKNQLNCLYTNREAVRGFDLSEFYWSSTEFTNFSSAEAWSQYFGDGTEFQAEKSDASIYARCVRAFTPP